MTIELTDKYKIITADEGMVLTEWQKGDNILDYSFATKQISPLSFDESILHEITVEESDRLLAEQEAIIRQLK